VSRYRNLRLLLPIYMHVIMPASVVLLALLFEEYQPGDKVTWFCYICKRRMPGIYPDPQQKRPFCDGRDRKRKHEPQEMEAKDPAKGEG
jgi:hypothetical protein